MQINAQSLVTSLYLQTEQQKTGTPAATKATTPSAPQDTVTLSPASLALASGESLETGVTAYGSWPVWPIANEAYSDK